MPPATLEPGQLLLTAITGVPALAVALVGWVIDRRDLQAQILHLREQNAKLAEALQVALLGRLAGERAPGTGR